MTFILVDIYSVLEGKRSGGVLLSFLHKQQQSVCNGRSRSTTMAEAPRGLGDVVAVRLELEEPDNNVENGVEHGQNNAENERQLRPRDLFAAYMSLKLWQQITCVLAPVLTFLLAFFILLLIFGGKSPPPSNPTKGNALFEKLVRGEYEGNVFNGTWISGSEFFYLNRYEHLVIHDCKDNSDRVIVDRAQTAIDSRSFDFRFSADRQYLLFGTNYQSIFRHSVLANYYTINLSTQKIKLISESSLALIKWAPVGQGIAYVSDNFNLWYKPYPEHYHDIEITTNGNFTIFNGIPDWVYEEEILESNKAIWFSGDGKKLAFITFDDTMVPIFHIPYYATSLAYTSQYTLQHPLHYPKVGRNNPTVEVKVADLSEYDTYGINVTSYPPPDSIKFLEPIITSITWATNYTFLLIWTNRYQNISSYCMCSTVSGKCEEKFVYKQTNGWINPHFDPKFDPKGERMVSIFRIDEGENDLYPQVVLFDFTQETVTPKPLTRGKISVSEIAKWDTDKEIVYFISTVEGKPEQLQTHFVSSKSNESSGNYTCLSCNNYKTIDGKQCLYTGSMFSTDCSYYAITCAGPDVPEVTIYDKTHSPIMIWERNDRLRQLMKKTFFPKYTILDVPLEDNFTAKVYLNHPEIDPSQDTKYPLLIRVYSGPESALVTERFTINFDKYYASNRSVYIATIDTRGSGLRGSRNLFTLYRKLGTVEIEDQLTVIKYLIKEYKHIDPTKIGVWGWSYGGYVTGMMMATDTENIIKCGVLVAPVTDWILYDTMYTERYMGANTKTDNYEGYYNSSLNRHALGLKNKMFFLIHGTKDDNVHYQNSMFLASVLEKNDILFRQLSYPDEDHSLRRVYPHFYHSIQQFLDECFDRKQTTTRI